MTSLAGTDIAGELEVGASAVAIMEYYNYCRRSTRTRDIMQLSTGIGKTRNEEMGNEETEIGNGTRN